MLRHLPALEPLRHGPNFPDLYLQFNVILMDERDAAGRHRRTVPLDTPSPYHVWYVRWRSMAATRSSWSRTPRSERLGRLRARKSFPLGDRTHACLQRRGYWPHRTSEAAVPTPTPSIFPRSCTCCRGHSAEPPPTARRSSGRSSRGASTDGMSIILDPYGRHPREAVRPRSTPMRFRHPRPARHAQRKTGMTNTPSCSPNMAFANATPRRRSCAC